VGQELRDEGVLRRARRRVAEIFEQMLKVDARRSVEPGVDAIPVHRSVERRLGRPRAVSAEAADVLSSPHLAGLTIPLARGFADERATACGRRRDVTDRAAVRGAAGSL
jgi:hypothetical protein